MNPRELIILILGLAIVAVVLRGLYVALKARRGQIKLSIDKNIPQDIDLEAMEFAELPGGGARIVERPLDSVNAQNSKLDEAQERASALNLGSSLPAQANIPVLMDAVELREAAPISTPIAASISTSNAIAEPEQIEPLIEVAGVQEFSATAAPEVAEVAEEEWSHNVEPVPQPELESTVTGAEDGIHSSSREFLAPIDEDDHDQNLANDQRIEVEADGDYDDVLLDYDQNDHSDNNQNDNDQNYNTSRSETEALANIAPDYPKTDVEPESNETIVEEDWESGMPIEDVAGARQNVQVEEDVLDQDDWDEQDNPDEDDDSNLTEASGSDSGQSFEEQLDDFSMTAGDRIGYDNNIIKAVTAARSNPLPEITDAEEGLSDQTNVLADTNSDFEEKNQSAEKEIKRASFFSNFRRKPKEAPEQPAPVQLEEKVEIEAEPDEVNIPREEIADRESVHLKSEVTTAEDDRHPQSDVTSVAAADNQPSEVLVVNVMARGGHSFAGDDLLQVLITAGLKFGEMNIFHHHLDSNTKDAVLYSVANVLNPGTFDLNNMSDFSTLGVSFFLALPTSINNLDAFETMLSVAQQIKGGLDGELRDDERNLMTAQTIEHYRQRVRDFELRQLKAGIRS